MEKKTPARVYHVNYICDDCKTGAMEYQGSCLSFYPPQYPHICNWCGAKATFLKAYPTHEIHPDQGP